MTIGQMIALQTQIRYSMAIEMPRETMSELKKKEWL